MFPGFLVLHDVAYVVHIYLWIHRTNIQASGLAPIIEGNDLQPVILEQKIRLG